MLQVYSEPRFSDEVNTISSERVSTPHPSFIPKVVVAFYWIH